MSHDERDDYWKLAPSRRRGPDDLARESPSKGVYKLYVCDTCKLAFGHPLSYCPSCPGKMVRVEGGSYREFADQRPGYLWGEDAAWEGRWDLYQRLAGAEKGGAVIPCVVTAWEYVSKFDEREARKTDQGWVFGEIVHEKLIPRLVREFGVPTIAVRSLPDMPDHVEVRFEFPSFRAFDEWRVAHHRRGLRYRIDPVPTRESSR